MFSCNGRTFPLGKKTHIVGILNATPDSFSDGGKYLDVDAAEEWARRMISDGADIIDVGGESTRPGFTPVGADEEIRRVVPIIERLAPDVVVSIDTTKPEVARAAIGAGAHIVNDIWGFHRAPALAEICAESGAGAILTHNGDGVFSGDIMAEMKAFFKTSAFIARRAGMRGEQIVIDPGIGFGKNLEQNLEVMKRLGELKTLGFPILTGTSRKSMIGAVLDLPVGERVEGTAATVALSIAYGADFVRVHDVKEMKRVAMMTDAIVRGR